MLTQYVSEYASLTWFCEWLGVGFGHRRAGVAQDHSAETHTVHQCQFLEKSLSLETDLSSLITLAIFHSN